MGDKTEGCGVESRTMGWRRGDLQGKPLPQPKDEKTPEGLWRWEDEEVNTGVSRLMQSLKHNTLVLINCCDKALGQVKDANRR